MDGLKNLAGAGAIAASLAGAAEAENTEAYIQGALETSEVPVLFVDPDQLDPDDWVVSGRILEGQLNSQSPGGAEALQMRFQEYYNEEYGIDYANVPMSEIAQMLYESGPSSIANIDVRGAEYCIITQPLEMMDEAVELSQALALSADQGLGANITGTSIEYNRYVGRHEGEHCNRPDVEDIEPDSAAERAQILAEEVRADQSALEAFDAEFDLEISDLRNLSAGADVVIEDGVHINGDHSTGIFLNSDVSITEYHIEAAETFRGEMDGFVDHAILSGQYTGVGTNAAEVLEQNPEAYFAIARTGFNAERDRFVHLHNTNPTFESSEPIISNLIKSEYAQGYEDAYRRRILGQDVPDREFVGFPEFEEAFLAEHERRLALNPYEPEPICSAQATVISPDGLNMRREADQFSEVVVRGDDGTPTALPVGSTITVYDSEESPLGGIWREAVSVDGRIGYVSERYLDIGPTACQPAASAPTP